MALPRDFDEVRDVTIIGGGPVGLSAAFWAGMREASARIVDSLPELGGQLTALYPDKWIYDVPGYPRIRARELVERHREQTLEPFDVPVHLETTAERIDWEPDPGAPDRRLVVLHTDRGELRSRTVIVAGGHGAFEPKTLPGLDLERWEGRGLHFVVGQKDAFAGRRVLIVGGGDSACDWAVNLLDVADSVALAHRRDGFRAHERTVAEIMSAADAGRMDVHLPYQVSGVRGNGGIEAVRLRHSERDDDAIELPCDALLLQLGFKTSLGPLADWGFEIEKGAIKIDPLCATNLEGVWACGDITTFPGKLKLIATGYAEAAIAVSQALHAIRPEMRIQPQYSTNTGVPAGRISGAADGSHS